ncbi:MAG: hypothetical protein ACLQBA_06165 [Candidatus Binataceae bacterium]
MKKSSPNSPKTAKPSRGPKETVDAHDAAAYRKALKKAQREKTMDWEMLKREFGLEEPNP